ncbi:MAG: bifunctional folylpolyglutamate synthase/dihydrofolate synthase [Cytophagales bacterium]|nr:bifunctional folylpolyglutamate synthase/dihydrofolate synthase [Cytophagales bacterium]MCA6367351.1 bifunctional folylpolyglutamate synthase/dihydrofolate synthase [Cytophagales bacterium]MCA6371708.1 bifunctional folylpolyglutamate synthase/dihydrofolate synthase [Cytophagales bacterium]MCA6376164.1 bifunctional folylpolyglutamate synthase/dihydrofolate synthase [Cytophagales bacterium]MCA6383984.1 bifunctional folylpolyglutamate synthase/dihydrofolate synthase [Cytophagales bacterium]
MLISSYQLAIEYLYQNLPMFQRIGAVAYKADLFNTIKLCNALGNPQNKFKSIHIAGTNGKGSSSHMLAAILQTAGYKTGLYTSPHLKEFTERIRINGIEIDQASVVDFVLRFKPTIEEVKPSFFEITVAMAFEYFAQQQVDVAVIEVGLGGRLDSTNVITPMVSLITNISWDHQDLLGDTLPKIAFEKAGIIKQSVPVIISERNALVDDVFSEKSLTTKSSIQFATDDWEVSQLTDSYSVFHKGKTEEYVLDLKGAYQRNNLAGVLATVEVLQSKGFHIEASHVRQALKSVINLTGLKGRWQLLGAKPTIICDTGHNEGGVKEVVAQLGKQDFRKLFIVWGSVKDKDITTILSLLPKEAYYFFCEAKIPRAMNAGELFRQAAAHQLKGEVVPDVNEAIETAKRMSGENDLIFIGGSTFVVAEIEGL